MAATRWSRLENGSPAQQVLSAVPGASAGSDEGAQVSLGGVPSESINIMDGVSIPNLDALKSSGIPSATLQQPWRRRGLLEQNTPPARPGMAQKWIRTLDVEGKPDPMNVRSSLLEGWKPRSIDTISDGQEYAVSQDATFGSVLSVMGMVLMERSRELDDQSRMQMTMETDRKTRAIASNQFDGADSRYAGTRYEQQRQTSIGGRIAPVDD